MAARSQYNERLQFEDPSGQDSASRSTRYRARKRARKIQEDEPCGHVHMNVPDLETLAGNVETLAGNVETLAGNEDLALTDHCDPQYLEAEVSNEATDDAADQGEDETSTADDHCGQLSTDDTDLIYNGAPLTVATSSIMVMQYKLRHKLTDQAVADLLHLLKLHCPNPNQCVPSVYHLKKRFQDVNFSIKFHYFCSNCLQGVEKSDTHCTNQLCTTKFDSVDNRSSFIEVPIEPQLQTLFKCKYSARANYLWYIAKVINFIHTPPKYY